MKKLIVSCLFFLTLSTVQGFNSYPLTVILHNTSGTALVVSIEYRLDQYYTHSNRSNTPLVPNNSNYHYSHKLSADEKKEMQIFAFHPCAKPFCFLHENLSLDGFTHGYKMLRGSVTIRDNTLLKERSYDFSKALFDDGTLTLGVTTEGISLSATKVASHDYAFFINTQYRRLS